MPTFSWPSCRTWFLQRLSQRVRKAGGGESTSEHMRKVWTGPIWMTLLPALCQGMAESRLMLGTFFVVLSSLLEEESAVSQTLEMESDPVPPASAEPPETSSVVTANKVREDKPYFLVSPSDLMTEQLMLRNAANG